MSRKKRYAILLAAVLMVGAFVWMKWLGAHRVYDPMTKVESYDRLAEYCEPYGLRLPEKELLPGEGRSFWAIIDGIYDWIRPWAMRSGQRTERGCIA